MLILKCITCKKDCKLEEMVKNIREINGYAKSCKLCYAERSLNQRFKYPVKNMYSAVKSSAKKRGLEFNLDISDIKIPKKCPYLNINLAFSVGYGITDAAPTIDRIDNSKGYIKGNIQVISYKANRAKSNLNQMDLITFAQNILKIHGFPF